MSAGGAKCCREDRAEQRGWGGERAATSNRELRAGLPGRVALKQKPEELKEEHSQVMETTRTKDLRWEGLACWRSSTQQRGAGGVGSSC